MTYSGSIHEFWISDPLGNRLQNIEPIRAEGVRMLNDYGTMVLQLDSRYDYLIKPDRIIEWWRGTEPGAHEAVAHGFVRGWQFSTDSDGRDLTKVWGPDQNELLARRIVAYKAGQTQTARPIISMT